VVGGFLLVWGWGGGGVQGEDLSRRKGSVYFFIGPHERGQSCYFLLFEKNEN